MTSDTFGYTSIGTTVFATLVPSSVALAWISAVTTSASTVAPRSRFKVIKKRSVTRDRLSMSVTSVMSS